MTARPPGPGGRSPARPSPRSRGIEIVAASPATWDAVVELFARRGGGDARFCWCAWWRVRAKDFAAPAVNRERLRGLVESGPPPALVALDGDRAVGWVALGPRPAFERLERSRKIPRVDGPTPWAIVCFVIAADARGHGIATALLQAAVEHARQAGATAVEGIPIDPSAAPDGRVADTAAYSGTRLMFERAGFRMVAPTSAVSGGAPRVVMRRELA